MKKSMYCFLQSLEIMRPSFLFFSIILVAALLSVARPASTVSIPEKLVYDLTWTGSGGNSRAGDTHRWW